MEKIREKELALFAAKLRKNIVLQVYSANSGHPGGSLSIADILSYLYNVEMNVDAKNPKDPNRDRFVLSKGHASPAIYAALALKGYFDEEELKKFRNIKGILQGHPDMKGVPGVDMSSGSLGQGISAACGMAIAGKKTNKDYRVYAVLGDGEIEEGQVWEAAMFAAHYKLDNLCAFLDLNGLQIDGKTADVMSSAPADEKFKAFGWNVLVIDGHSFEEIEAALNNARNTKGKPTMIVCNTTKGKGVSYMENQAGWHGAAPTEEQFNIAMAELDAAIAALEE